MIFSKLRYYLFHPFESFRLKVALDRVKAKMPTDIREAHQHCSNHKQEVLSSKECGCFYCLEVFTPDRIEEWVDDGQCALCPSCDIDAVIGDKAGYPLTKKFLSDMHKHWFEDDLPND
jgi:hypothetical protein